MKTTRSFKNEIALALQLVITAAVLVACTVASTVHAAEAVYGKAQRTSAIY